MRIHLIEDESEVRNNGEQKEHKYLYFKIFYGGQKLHKYFSFSSIEDISLLTCLYISELRNGRKFKCKSKHRLYFDS